MFLVAVLLAGLVPCAFADEAMPTGEVETSEAATEAPEETMAPPETAVPSGSTEPPSETTEPPEATETTGSETEVTEPEGIHDFAFVLQLHLPKGNFSILPAVSI